MRRPLLVINIHGDHRVTDILERLNHMATQADVDRITTAIDTATTGIRSDIADLKAAAEAGANLDFTALDAKVDALAALDAELPAAPAETPVEAPVDPTV